MSKFIYIFMLLFIKSSFALSAEDDFPHWVVNSKDDFNSVLFTSNDFISSNGILDFTSSFIKITNIEKSNLRITYKKMSGCQFRNGENIPDSNIFLLINSKEYREYQEINTSEFRSGENGAEVSIKIKGLNNSHYGAFSCRLNGSLIYSY